MADSTNAAGGGSIGRQPRSKGEAIDRERQVVRQVVKEPQTRGRGSLGRYEQARLAEKQGTDGRTSPPGAIPPPPTSRQIRYVMSSADGEKPCEDDRRTHDVRLGPGKFVSFVRLWSDVAELTGEQASEVVERFAEAHLDAEWTELAGSIRALAEAWPDGTFGVDLLLRLTVDPRHAPRPTRDESVMTALEVLYEFMEHPRTQEHLEQVLAHLKLFLGNRRKVVNDLDAVQGRYQLLSVHVWTGHPAVPTALIELRLPNGEEQLGKGTGVGPVDACYQAIVDIVGQRFRLVDYVSRALEEGANARAKVDVIIEAGGERYKLEAQDEDTFYAAAAALVEGLNETLGQDESLNRNSTGAV